MDFSENQISFQACLLSKDNLTLNKVKAIEFCMLDMMTHPTVEVWPDRQSVKIQLMFD